MNSILNKIRSVILDVASNKNIIKSDLCEHKDNDGCLLL